MLSSTKQDVFKLESLLNIAIMPELSVTPIVPNFPPNTNWLLGRGFSKVKYGYKVLLKKCSLLSKMVPSESDYTIPLASVQMKSPLDV